ncbi:MAG: hypothetical protein LUE29_01465 [Lachnospiraceae bacterium]|nr:hypothetical protein [Lachnospiraceae bacterium]
MELYSEEQEQHQKTKAKAWTVAAEVIAGASLVGCIVCCVLTTTATAEQMMQTATILSTLGGWFVIFAVTAQILPNRRQAQHEANVLEGERAMDTGIITVEPEVLQIPKSIAICKVVVDTGTEKKRLSIRADKAKLLKERDGQNLILYTVYGYIAAFEETGRA